MNYIEGKFIIYSVCEYDLLNANFQKDSNVDGKQSVTRGMQSNTGECTMPALKQQNITCFRT